MKIGFLGGCDIDDCYTVFDQYPQLGEKSFIGQYLFQVGGMVANASIVGSSLGIDTVMIHELSDYEQSTSYILDELVKNKVNTDGISLSKRANKKCIIFKKDGERSIFVTHSEELAPIILTKTQQSLLKTIDCLYTTISDLQVFEQKIDILSQAKERGQKIFIDCDCDITIEGLQDLKYATIISINEFGYNKLESMGYDAFRLQKEFNIPYTLVTYGAKGSELYFMDTCLHQRSFENITIQDTTGAGDTFNISFLYALNNKLSLQDCLLFATACAAYSIEFIGSHIPIDLSFINLKFLDNKLDLTVLK